MTTNSPAGPFTVRMPRGSAAACVRSAGRKSVDGLGGLTALGLAVAASILATLLMRLPL